MPRLKVFIHDVFSMRCPCHVYYYHLTLLGVLFQKEIIILLFRVKMKLWPREKQELSETNHNAP